MEEMGSKTRVLMLPWLAHGHISPFLELAKSLISTNKSFHIYLCSTPVTLSSIKPNIPENCSHSIELIELHLPSQPDLPPHLHTTKGLPPHLMLPLKRAFESSSTPTFSTILDTLKPDLLIYEFLPSWASEMAMSHNVPAVNFVVTAAVFASYLFHAIEVRGRDFPFPTIHLYDHENAVFTKALRETSICNDPTSSYQFVECIKGGSSGFVLIKSCEDLEGKYMDYLSILANKKIVPVGPLIQEPVYDQQQDNKYSVGIKRWLDNKEPRSTVLVSFGTECFLGEEEMEEIAYGLERSKVSFIWVLKFPIGEKVKIEEKLPNGFLEKVGERGLVVQGWAPQARILGHPSIGGFVSHCGWSSVMESIKFGVPIIAMPMHIDQPWNARLVVEIGVGVEVKRDKSGKIERHEVAKVIKEVVVEKTKVGVRERVEEMRLAIEKGQEGICRVAHELIQLCGTK